MKKHLLRFALSCLASAAFAEEFAPRWAITEEGEELRIAYGNDASMSQYGALHRDSSYLRLNYGPRSGWGTSVVLLPTFWIARRNYQGAPVTATWSVAGSNLLIRYSGRIAELDVAGQVLLQPPAGETIVADVSATVDGHQALDVSEEGSFKILMLSSMRVSKDQWDAREIFVDKRTYPIPAQGRIIPSQPFINSRRFGLVGGTSEWKPNAPSICVLLDKVLRVSGWVTPTRDPNADNVGVFAAANNILPSYAYRIMVTSEDGIGNLIHGKSPLLERPSTR